MDHVVAKDKNMFQTTTATIYKVLIPLRDMGKIVYGISHSIFRNRFSDY